MTYSLHAFVTLGFTGITINNQKIERTYILKIENLDLDFLRLNRGKANGGIMSPSLTSDIGDFLGL